MKKTILASLGLVTISLVTTAVAQIKPADQIKYRQSAYSFASWNMGKIKTNLDAKNYNAEQVKAAATAISAVAGSGLGALFGAPGGNTKPEIAKPENQALVAQLAGDFAKAAKELSAAAERGDKALVEKAFAKTGGTCKACHEKFKK